MIEGAIFDMDGVLIDNARYHIRAWQRLGKDLGSEFSPAAISSLFGQRNFEIVKDLLGSEYSQAESDRLAERKEAIYRNLIRAEMVPVPGLPAFLERLKLEGIPAAVATSAPMENVEMTLKGLGLESYWAAVVIGADVSRGKPAPDIFLLAAKRLNLAPERCVVFEDSTSGIQAAISAGCQCIGISTTHTAEELLSYPLLGVFPDFTELWGHNTYLPFTRT
jgi:beta-phosphoglucomutase